MSSGSSSSRESVNVSSSNDSADTVKGLNLEEDPRVKNQSLISKRKSRQSPEGKEREFPTTRAPTPAVLTVNRVSGSNPVPGVMGAGDDRYFHPANLRCASQIGGNRDFHYTVQDHGQPGSAQTAHYRGQRASRQHQQEAGQGSYHSPHASALSGAGGTGTSTRTRSGTYN